MKKLSKKQKEWLIKRSLRLVEYRNKRNPRNRSKRLQRKAKKEDHGKRIQNFLEEVSNNNDFVEIYSGKLKIYLPESFDLSENYEKTIRIINVIRNVIEFQPTVTKSILSGISFDKMKFISTSASLLLIAEIDAWNRSVGVKLRALVHTWHPDVLNHFSQIGFFDLIDCSTGQTQIPEKSAIKFLSGNTIDQKNTGQVIKDIRNKIENLVGGNIHKQRLYESLNESLLNVSYHAYSNEDCYKMWWLTASFDEQSMTLRVAFCDRGVTIPESMKHTKKGKHFLSVLGIESKHHKRIKVAMEGISSSELSNRGTGLPFLKNFIQSNNNGKLHLMSGKGYYMYENTSKNEVSKERLTNYQGTLITWSISVE